MKAKPLKIENGEQVECLPEDATHLLFKLPSNNGLVQCLPVITKGSRRDNNAWTWNGDTEKPTLRPSVLVTMDYAGKPFRCHSWVNDGEAQFLSDCSHELVNQTVELLEVI